MKALLSIVVSALLFVSLVNAQQVVLKRKSIANGIKEKYHVLKSNRKVKQGLYQVTYHQYALASGMYINDKKTGIWHFYDYQAKLMQNFNFDNNLLTYEASEDSTSNFQYVYDKALNDTDRVTKPIRIGGRYYGYLPYLKILEMPDYIFYWHDDIIVLLEILVSPGGNLADYTVHFKTPDYQKTLNVNIDRLNTDDKLFIPATINGEPVSSRIIIRCRMNTNRVLTL